MPRLRPRLAPPLGAVGALRWPGRRALPHRVQPRRAAAGQGAGLLGAGAISGDHTPGAGGYGDPRERDRALVRRDLDEGVISDAVARDAYGFTEP
jgi:N-methylhydantoinase B/oxoprolinase/acetone carboxylase alpha subunit